MIANPLWNDGGSRKSGVPFFWLSFCDPYHWNVAADLN
jgi:hypothetical protein